MIRTLLLLALFLPIISLAQPAGQKTRVTTNALYIEAFGSSFLFYNLAYDRILVRGDKTLLSGSLGLQYNFIGDRFVEFDLGLSPGLNLIFKGRHLGHFEMGAGAALYPQITDQFYFPFRMGYRRQNLTGVGSFFKIAFTPVLIIGNGSLEQIVLPWAGVAYGVGF